MRLKVRRMGSSSGVILPGPVLAAMGVDPGDGLDAEFVDGRLVLALAAVHPRAGWAVASEEIASARDDALVWPEFSNAEDATSRW